MMVERLMKDLEQATKKLEEINQKPQTTEHELKDLITALQHFNKTLPASLDDKKLVTEGMGMNKKIETALNAIQVFHRQHPEKDRRNVDQAIASLSSALMEALNAFDRNLKNLKEYKIGQKVEKTGQSKQS
jgi:hypothetical protein